MLDLTRKARMLITTGLVAFVLAACGAATSSTQPAATAGSGAAVVTSQPAQPATQDVTAQPGTAAAAAPAKLNLNEVTQDQLMSTIPNFSTRMVREFMEYRPYISIQQFRKEIGKYVSQDVVAGYEQYVYVPVDVDQADAATLQQLPGVDAAIADQLIAGRPYSSNQAFLDKLAGAVSATDAQQAAAYLAT